MRLFLNICLFLICIAGYSQRVSDTSFVVNSHSYYPLNLSGYSSLVFDAIPSGYSDQHIILGNDTFSILEDPHISYSSLVEIDEYIQVGYFYSGSYSGIIHCKLLAVESLLPHQRVFHLTVADTCLPPIIPVSNWRQGLTPPAYTPSKTTTEHIIVHHAATSNSDTDPFQTVRNIYVQHTQVNGWSDIGYNFLIGRDGTIFQGRDSKGLFDYDYVVGAHMCGRNNGTMGICLLGNYIAEKPTEAALKSLQKLIAWKSEKDKIDIFGSSLHPIGPANSGIPDSELNHVAGHREGCKSGYTECPGETLFALLPQIKDASEQIKSDVCDGDTTITVPSSAEFLLFPNPATSYFQTNFDFDSVVVYDLRGNFIPGPLTVQDRMVNLPMLPQGMYMCHFFIESRNRYHRLLVQQEW